LGRDVPSQVHVLAMAPVAEAAGYPSRCQTDPRGKRADALVQFRSSSVVFAASFSPFMHCCTGPQGFPGLDCASCFVRIEKARLPPDLAFTLRDSSTSRDTSLHPPVLKFVLVNVLLPAHAQRPLSHRRFHSSTRVCGTNRSPVPSSWFLTTSTA